MLPKLLTDIGKFSLIHCHVLTKIGKIKPINLMPSVIKPFKDNASTLGIFHRFHFANSFLEALTVGRKFSCTYAHFSYLGGEFPFCSRKSIGAVLIRTLGEGN
jgi:hypothetical protein